VFYERVRFDIGRGRDESSHRFNFLVADDRRPEGPADELNNARDVEQFSSTIETTAEERVTGEQWNTHDLLAIFPPANGFVEWQEDVEPLCDEQRCDGLFVLMARVDRAPTRVSVDGTSNRLSAGVGRSFANVSHRMCPPRRES
jgi:hypothetical protein